jgi:hypothetical protein
MQRSAQSLAEYTQIALFGQKVFLSVVALAAT